MKRAHDTPLLAASKAAEGWLNTVGFVAYFGPGSHVDQLYPMLTPTWGGRTNRTSLMDSYKKHIGTLNKHSEQFERVSAGDVIWEHGKGLSGISPAPNACYPECWPSAHAAAAGVAKWALELLVGPVIGIADKTEQRETARQVLADHWQALATTPTWIAKLQAAIRRERKQLPQVLLRPLPENGEPVAEEDVPAEFREGGVLAGAPLTAPYLADATAWDFSSVDLSNARKAGALTRWLKVGKPNAYLFSELCAMRDRRKSGKGLPRPKKQPRTRT